MVQAKLVSVDGTVSDVEVTTFRGIQTLVGGTVECFWTLGFEGRSYLAAFNESGRFLCARSTAKFDYGHGVEAVLHGPVVLFPEDFDMDSIPYE